MVVVGFFVFLHGLPENSVDFFEMLDAFAEFSLLSHQQSVASLQFLKAQAQSFLRLAPVRGMGRAMASLRLKLFDRRVKHLAVFEQIKRLREVQRLWALCAVMPVRMDLNVARTKPHSLCEPRKIRLARHQAAARAWRSSSL